MIRTSDSGTSPRKRFYEYRRCNTCSEVYYPEQPGQTTCKLCRTEQAFRTIRENDYAAKSRKRAERKARKAA